MAHTLKETIDLAVKTAILRAHPIGSYYLTEGNENPADFIGGGNRLKSLVIQASDDTHLAGTTAEAGLPNITGVFSRKVNNSYGFKGAFYEMELGEKTSGEYGGTGCPSGVGFDASRSNAIYGKSDTVQPPARFCNVWKRIS